LYDRGIRKSLDGLFVAILDVLVVATGLADARPMSIKYPSDAVEVTPIIAGVLDGIFGFQLCHG
jgi:hypothetical protein